jgi:hypothetical protein
VTFNHSSEQIHFLIKIERKNSPSREFQHHPWTMERTHHRPDILISLSISQAFCPSPINPCHSREITSLSFSKLSCHVGVAITLFIKGIKKENLIKPINQWCFVFVEFVIVAYKLRFLFPDSP